MADKLLIRAYNVGCGDCVYVRIPGPNAGFHILIDCGKKGGSELLQKAIQHLREELPDGKSPGKKRIDLLVATHRHEDHIKGFDPDWFEDIEVKNIWLSVAMDPKHPQAQGVTRLHAFATQAMRGLIGSRQALSPDIEALASLYGVSNDQADKLLMKTLPAANGIKPKYVYSGMKATELGVKLPADTAIHILAPERDIDHFYLGEEADASFKSLLAFSAAIGTGKARPAASNGGGMVPKNISATDFEVLQSRMLSNALAFAAKDSSIQNNLSVVLLIEWKKRRLLFVGDAEWEEEFREGKHNGSWNVMWEKHGRTHLAKPVDFLKVGHHGSINATPPPAPAKSKEAAAGVYEILDAILPLPCKETKPTAQAIVSTEREYYNPIPECKLLAELARRVINTRNYGKSLGQKGIDPKTLWTTAKAKKNKFFETYEEPFLNEPQAIRTDLEFALSGAEFVEVEIKPKA